MKTAIAEYGQTNGIYPGAATAPSITDLAVAGQYSNAAVTADTGVITVTMGAAGTVNANIAGGIITLTPPALNTDPTSFDFACASTNVEQKYLPTTCTGI
ncbi:pilin [Pseudomonas stutzeri]|nr:pilin [Stutzerimonas stutzeri]